jgi:hypothetical protein
MNKKAFILDEISKGRDKTRQALLTTTDPWLIARLYKHLDDLLMHYIRTLDKRA